MIRHGLTLCVLLLCCWLPATADTVFKFESPAEEQRFQTLTGELRCLVCQNQSLADSHADLAGDLRQEIFRMLRERKSDQEIIDFLVQRYGDFVLYRPRVDRKTFALWFGPAILLILGLYAINRGIRRRQHAALPSLSGEQQRQVAILLNDEPEPGDKR
jgi:cytochrome c-type biogenesis protein CcmH